MAGFGSSNGSATLTDEDAQGLSDFIQQTDEAKAVSRPSNVERFWPEFECDAGEAEQRELYKEKGEVEARGPEKAAAELCHEADSAIEQSAQLHDQASTGAARLEVAKEVLGRHVRRRTDAKLTYWLRWILLLGGDIAGIGGAALLLGEQPLNAVMQAISAAVSALTLGGVGRELRYLLAARARQKDHDQLDGAERLYAQWFAGPDSAEAVIRIVLLLCVAGLALVAGGIFALRDAAEGLIVAIAFSCFALAFGLASLYNTFDVADDVAEHLDAQALDVKRLQKVAAKASQNPAIGRRAGAVTEARSVREANAAAGEAAAIGLRRRLYGMLNQNPGVAGNGPAAKRNGNHRSNGRRRPEGS